MPPTADGRILLQLILQKLNVCVCVCVMEMNISTQGPVMVFSEHLQTVGFIKLGSFYTNYQLFKNDCASWSYLHQPQKNSQG
jgi:hypothetical protein